MPSGIPMMLRNIGMAVATCPKAIQIPATITQMTFPRVASTPVPRPLSTTVRPKGQRA